IKGKLRYMSPEQLRGGAVDRRTDVYAAGVVLWETLTQQSLFDGENEGEVVTRVLARVVEPPSALVASLPRALDAIVLKALARDPGERFATAREMALALEECVPIASSTRVAAWVTDLAGDLLAARAKPVAESEQTAVATTIVAPTAVPAPRRPWLAAAIASAVAASALAFVATGAPWRPAETPHAAAPPPKEPAPLPHPVVE